MRLTISGLQTRGGMNAREHHYARAKRVRTERETVSWFLRGQVKPPLPCVVTLTRIAPSNGLDPFENLPSSLKGCVDAFAQWIGVDDKDPAVRYVAKQERGPWSVRIEVQPA